MLQSSTQDITVQGKVAIRLTINGASSPEVLRSDPQPVFLGYPHGPKTSDWVPLGRLAETAINRFEDGGVADITASEDSFACSTDKGRVLGSTYGQPDSPLNDSVYDRKGDWLVSAAGDKVSVLTLGRGKYRIQVTGKGAIYFRPDFYSNHLGYFLWDHKKPLWKEPVAGWCSWAAHGQDVKEEDMVDAAKFFSQNLLAYGYDVVQMDDGYQRVLQNKDQGTLPEPFSNYWTIPNKKFPHGLKWLASEIAKTGVIPGIWVGFYAPLGLKHAEGYVLDEKQSPQKGPWVGYAMNGFDKAARDEAYIDTVRDLHADGWRYFKIDTLRHILYDNYRQSKGYWAIRNQSMEQAYRMILSEVKKAVGDSYLLACWGTLPELAGIPDGCRIGEDVGDDFASMRRTAKYISQFRYLNNVVWRNDPDYMCLRVPVDQAKAWVTMNFLAGGHLMVSDPITAYDKDRIDVMRRAGPPIFLRPDSVVAHDPDPEFMTLSAQKFDEQWTVVSRFAWADMKAAPAPLEKFGLNPAFSYLAFDFWNEKYLGAFDHAVPFDALKQGSCQVISLRLKLDHPQVLGTDRHLSQGAEELENVKWEGNSLSGRFLRAPGRPWAVYIHVTPGFKVGTVSKGISQSMVGPEVLKLEFPDGKTPVDWKVEFTK